MKYNNTLALIPAVLLAACGGDEQSINEPVSPGSVVYSYPADGQGEISPEADLVLRFSHALSDDGIEGKVKISDGEDNIAFSSESVDQGQSLKIMPDEKLSAGTEYTITFSEDLEAEGGRVIPTPNATGPDGIQFTTRGEFSGIAELDNLGAGFEVAEMIPSEGHTFRPMNFSTFRLRLTRAVHPQWQERGGVIELTDSNGETVPATVLVNGRYITIDPCIGDAPEACGREDDVLESGETYTVSLRDLPGVNGETLDEFSEEVTPRDTSPTVVLFQELVDSGLNAGIGEADVRRSRLNGEIINGVTLNSVLQGVAGPSQQTGGLFAELAYAPSFEADEPLPLRVPKGSILSSSSLDVRINGSVPVIDPKTGEIQKTGDIKVTMLSDATGYLMPNPYTDDMNAPRHVRLFMDVSMNTEEAQPNASLSQDLLGVELSGIAMVEDGVLTIDAIGMVEPNLLGQEFTDSTIAFRIEAATDSESALDAAEQRDEEMTDTTGPQLVSWMPGPEDATPETRQDMQRPGDPIILNFDEPLDADSVADGVTIDEGGTPLTVGDDTLNAEVDGTALVLNPEGGLKHGVDYAVNINGITDIAGNAGSVPTLNFRLPEIGEEDDVTQRSPIALTTYPGYPCYVNQTDTPVDLNAGTHGQCADAAEDGPLGEVLPVTTLPKDRPIMVVFSQSMNLDSIRLNETFTVEKVSADGTAQGEISGRLEKNNQRIRFYPDEAWEVDGLYRYTMSSSAGGQCTDGASDGIICGENGLSLKTDLLVDPESVGGPAMEIYFRGGETQNSVFTPLRNLPIRDTNSNYVIDCFDSEEETDLSGTDCLEPSKHEQPDGTFAPSANAAQLAVESRDEDAPSQQQADAFGIPIGASVGCPADEECPDSKFIYQTYGLNTEVIGPGKDEDGNEGVRVLLYPTMLATTSASVFLDGLGEQATGPQILRMTYGKKTEDNPQGLVKGIIVEGDNGKPTFKTEADLTLDAPNLALPDGGTILSHNLYSYPIPLTLQGPIDFFDDGRMQIVQRNTNAPEIIVAVDVEIPVVGDLLDFLQDPERTFEEIANEIDCFFNPDDCAELPEVQSGNITIPLIIPENGVYLNFISNPVKEIPAEY